MLQRGHSGDGCDLLSTLCTYDLRNEYLFVLSWARVRQVRRRSISSEQCLLVWLLFLWLNVLAVFTVGGGALLDKPCMVFQIMCVLCL